MKKIKLLYWFIIGLILFYIISFLANLYLTFYPPGFMNFGEEFYHQFIFGRYTHFVGMTISIFSFIALFVIQKGLFATIKNGFFNQSSSGKFKLAGKLFLIFGGLSLFWDTTLLIYSKGEFIFFERLSQDVFILLIGFGLLIITDFINNGNALQQENNLTI